MTRFGSYNVELTHTDKLLYPQDGISKGDVIDYYRRIAGVMLSYLQDRPLALERYPDGIGAEGFFQQNMPDYFPDWFASMEVERSGDEGRIVHPLCNNQASLVYLANQGVLALHGWLSRRGSVRCPDKLIFDLDPPGDDFSQVSDAADKVAELMRDEGLHPYVMTTGSSGLHVVAPLTPDTGFDEVREAAKGLARTLTEKYPQQLTLEQRKEKRQGRLYLDVMRNAYGQTTIQPYSLRSKPGAPVATPLDWEELDDSDMHSQRYHLKNIFQRLGQKTDPWREMRRHAVSVKTLLKS